MDCVDVKKSSTPFDPSQIPSPSRNRARRPQTLLVASAEENIDAPDNLDVPEARGPELGVNGDLPPVPPLPSVSASYSSIDAALGLETAPQPQAHEPRWSTMISPDDLVTPSDMTGMQQPTALRGAGATARHMFNSPQRLQASSIVGDRSKTSVEVVMQGVKPFVHKSPWNPPAWSSPGKPGSAAASSLEPTAAEMTRTTSAIGCELTVTQRMLAWQLSNLDVQMASELVSYADQHRRRRVRRLVEQHLGAAQTSKRRSSMNDAVNLIAHCRGLDPYTPVEAEDIVRSRIGRNMEYPLHVYGFLIHIALYPITIILALVGCFQVALSASASVTLALVSSYRYTAARCISRALLMSCTLVMVIPIAVGCIALSAIPDILLLLARPFLPHRIKLAFLPWFFPTSLAFWSAGSCGFLPAFLANLLLGACPVSSAFISTSLGGQLCNTHLEKLPLSSAFQAAVVCAPHFMARQKSLRGIALRGIPEYYAPAGGVLARMPLVVQWGFLLGDRALCVAWEAECMGHLPHVNHKFDKELRGPQLL